MRTQIKPFATFTSLFLACFVLTLVTACGSQTNEPVLTQEMNAIPAPSSLTANVQVQGRVSTVKQVDIVHVGKKIPYTYSAGKISNSVGYDWWVSKHFALKSDLPEDKIRLYLELLELSYPHYVELFGAEPANIHQQRIAVVYGSSRARVREAMLDDGFTRGVHANAGGETMYYNRAGYSFPSSREQHQRYIVIHETMHAYHMALTGHSTWAPNWITEGLADAIAHHVYDPNKKQLAVMVFDRAPMNYVETGVRQYFAANEPSIVAINNDPRLQRGLNFLLIHFLLNDPERAQYFALFRDRLMTANPHSGDTLPVANQLLVDTFSEWEQLEIAFAEYMRSARSSFHIAYGPWEQNGSGYWIRSGKEKQMPRLDILLPHNRETVSHPVLDAPLPDIDPLVRFSQRVGNPVAGALFEFLPEQLTLGEVGMGIGLTIHPENEVLRKTWQDKRDNNLDSYLKVMLQGARYLQIEGVNMQVPYQATPLNEDIIAGIEKTKRLGVSIHSNQAGLQLTLRADKNEQEIAYSLPEDEVEKISGGDLTLLASGNNHRIAPYIPHTHRNKSSASVTATGITNQWLFPEMPLLQRVFRTCVELGLKVLSCDTKLAAVFDGILQQDSHPEVIRELKKLEMRIHDQLLVVPLAKLASTFTGLDTQLVHHENNPYIQINNTSGQLYDSQLHISWLDSQGETLHEDTVDVAETDLARLNIKLEPVQGASSIKLENNINWQGLALTLSDEDSVMPFDGVYLTSSPVIAEDELRVQASLSGPYSGDSTGKLHIEVFPTHAVMQSRFSTDVSFKPYEVISRTHQFSLNPTYEGQIHVRVIADIDVDGEGLLLKKEVAL